MAQNSANWLQSPILYLDTIDSTNNYAMQLIDADKAHYGTTIVAKAQSAGKGQRGKSWLAAPNESLLASFIMRPPFALAQQFAFSALVAVKIAEIVKVFCPLADIHIKWPNDIIVNDKKAGGILIENIIRGNQWSYAIVGTGINVLQQSFPDDLPTATSLIIAECINNDVVQLLQQIRFALFSAMNNHQNTSQILSQYNQLLYKKDEWQPFLHGEKKVTYRIEKVTENGQLVVFTTENEQLLFHHGELTWLW